MLRRAFAVSFAAIVMVACSNNSSQPSGPSHITARIANDTTVQLISAKGKVIQKIAPQQVESEKAEPTKDELIKQVWTDVGFSPELLMSQLIDAGVCSISAKQYVGCFYAAQMMSEVVNGSDTILHLANAEHKQFLGEKIADLGPFAVYKKIPQPTFHENDLAAISEDKKNQNDFSKLTVKEVMAVYDQKIAILPQVARLQNILHVQFPQFEERIKSANEKKDLVTVQTVTGQINSAMQELQKIKNELGGSAYKEYQALAVAAFNKTSEKERAFFASEVYGEYLRKSADGHARIEVNPSIVEAIEKSMNNGEPEYGIGVEMIQSADKGLYVRPISGSSASKAGVLENDRVISVGGVMPSDINEAVKKIKGPKNTQVDILVERWATKKQIKVRVSRQPLNQKSYQFSQIGSNKKKMGMLKIATFLDDDMAKAVRSYVQKNDKRVSGWVIDLRNNPGGLVDQAVELLSIFLPKGSATIMESEALNPDIPNTKTMRLTQEEPVTAKPVIVLINEHSASASEVVSGLIQEYKRGFIIGERSFGKGSMQSAPYPNHPDIPQLTIWTSFVQPVQTPQGDQKMPILVFWKTIGRYFYPSGRTPEWVGVQPDIQVRANPDALVEVFSPREQDLIPFSFGDLGKPWVNPRPEEVSHLQQCVQNTGVAIKGWVKADTPQPFAQDYQKMYALDALGCAAHQ